MSRTYKHIKEAKLKRHYAERWDIEYDKFVFESWKYVWPDFNTSVGTYSRVCYLKKAGVLTKKKKSVDDEHHWMTTPSWWNRIHHTRPERRSAKVALSKVSDVEEVDIPDTGRKPHQYFW